MQRSRHQSTLRPVPDVPIFALVSQVTIKKRLDVEGAAQKWGKAIPDLVAGAWRTPPVRA